VDHRTGQNSQNARESVNFERTPHLLQPAALRKHDWRRSHFSPTWCYDRNPHETSEQAALASCKDISALNVPFHRSLSRDRRQRTESREPARLKPPSEAPEARLAASPRTSRGRSTAPAHSLSRSSAGPQRRHRGSRSRGRPRTLRRSEAGCAGRHRGEKRTCPPGFNRFPRVNFVKASP